MSNHYHLVVRLNPDDTNHWSDDEVLSRWTALFKGPLLVQRYRAGAALSPAELEAVRSMTAVFRQRLGSLSWFMKCLNEPIARKANAEDGCTGHFWEARFQSQPLCSERALLTAMAYVDLNPIRAGIAKTPETSIHTSIHARTNADEQAEHAATRSLRRNELNHFDVPIRPLKPFDDGKSVANGDGLPMKELEYLKLVDSTGRVVVRGKRGRIDPALAPILERLGLSTEEWLGASMTFRHVYRNGDIRQNRVA
ncbi:MAG: hypothetical protein QNJ00_11190 [Woeseiaceae bacterium]|nr:hypothetical protein [Woeseiaceae bacterium]